MASTQPLSVSRWRSRRRDGSHTPAASPSFSGTDNSWDTRRTSAIVSTAPRSRAGSQQSCGDYMAVQHERAMAEVARLTRELEEARESQEELLAENKRAHADVQDLTDRLNQSQLVNLQLKFEADKMGNMHTAERWAAAAQQDELVQLRRANSPQKQAAKDKQVSELKEQVEKLNKICWQHEEASITLKKRFAQLCTDNARLQASTSAPDWSSGYGERDYQVLAADGLQYRATPNLTDVNTEMEAVPTGTIVTGTGLLQGPRTIFIQCKSGKGFLPVVSVAGEELLRHKGKFGGERLEHNEDGTIKDRAN